jgi:hypothetical protein
MSTLVVFGVIIFTGTLLLAYYFLRSSRELSGKHELTSNITRLPDRSETMFDRSSISGTAIGNLSFALDTLTSSKENPHHLSVLTTTGPLSIASSRTLERPFSVLSFFTAIKPRLANVFGTLRKTSKEVRNGSKPLSCLSEVHIAVNS